MKDNELYLDNDHLITNNVGNMRHIKKLITKSTKLNTICELHLMNNLKFILLETHITTTNFHNMQYKQIYAKIKNVIKSIINNISFKKIKKSIKCYVGNDTNGQLIKECTLEEILS